MLRGTDKSMKYLWVSTRWLLKDFLVINGVVTLKEEIITSALGMKFRTSLKSMTEILHSCSNNFAFSGVLFETYIFLLPVSERFRHTSSPISPKPIIKMVGSLIVSLSS